MQTTIDTSAELEQAITKLQRGAVRLANLPLEQRIALTQACLEPVHNSAREWVAASCRAKRVEPGTPAGSEEITGGPAAVLRFLQLMLATLRDIQQTGKPRLPGAPRQVEGQLRVPVFPTHELYDSLLFTGFKAETWLEPGVGEAELFGPQLDYMRGTKPVTPTVSLVLGAGNVSSIPVTDALSKILQEGQAVLLKMNPVNAYLGEIFSDALRPLIDAEILQIIQGGAETGAQAIQDDRIGAIHITGSIETHDTIVWGAPGEGQGNPDAQPLIDKPITSELSNVSPWLLVPAEYSANELRAQAETVAASIANNASFNCVATKMVITSRHWPQRKQFLDLLEQHLDAIPPRYAYYPGAANRYQEFSGCPVDPNDGYLPWKLLRNRTPAESPHLFERESFVCVCAETTLEAGSVPEFLEQAVGFANQELWGTLSVAITIPGKTRQQHENAFEQALAELQYGTIGINQWPALAFALMTPPWGGYPTGVSLRDAQSGLGLGPQHLSAKPTAEDGARNADAVVPEAALVCQSSSFRPSCLASVRLVRAAKSLATARAILQRTARLKGKGSGQECYQGAVES